MFISQSFQFLGKVVELPVFMGDGCLQGLILFVVEINSHFDLLFSVNFVLFIVIDYFLLFAVRSLDLFI